MEQENEHYEEDELDAKVKFNQFKKIYRRISESMKNEKMSFDKKGETLRV